MAVDGRRPQPPGPVPELSPASDYHRSTTSLHPCSGLPSDGVSGGPRARDWIPTRRGVKMARGAASHFNYERDTLRTISSSCVETRKMQPEALALVQEWTAAAGLTLHPTKTRVIDATEDDFEFLGYRFSKGKRFPRAKSMAKLKDAIRAETKRNSGGSLRTIIAKLNPRLRGWFEYFKHSYKTTFPELDQWIRGRLRSILRRRTGKRGRGRGSDHQRWPNAFFAAHGLYGLKTAHELVCQSFRR